MQISDGQNVEKGLLHKHIFLIQKYLLILVNLKLIVQQILCVHQLLRQTNVNFVGAF